MPDLSITLESIVKLFIFPLKDTSLDSTASNFSEIFQTKLSWKVEIFIIVDKFIDLFSINKQTSTTTIVMQTQTKFCFSSTKINT